jgi:hypothetical protein
MKTIFSMTVLAAAMLFTSCEKCYECKLDNSNGTTETESICGNPEEADTYEAAGYTCSAK